MNAHDDPGGARPTTVAIVGAGVVGRGWIPVFAGAACSVRVHDAQPEQLERASRWYEDFLRQSGRSAGDVRFVPTLPDAVAAADYVQESVGERIELKQALFAELERHAVPACLLASSTSSLDINEIAARVSARGRCFTVHPFNPASVVPVVEVMGTSDGTPEELRRVCEFMVSVGQRPVVMRRFVPGYVGNRLQAAVMREALDLVASGVTDADGIDAMLTHGLALRWALLGVFGTNHTNHDRGLVGYYGAFWEGYLGLMADLAVQPPALDPRMLEALEAAVARRFGEVSVEELARWRDEGVLRVRELQAALTAPGAAGRRRS